MNPLGYILEFEFKKVLNPLWSALRTGRGSNEKREVMRFLTVAVTIRLSDSDLSRLEKPPYTQQKGDIFSDFSYVSVSYLSASFMRKLASQ